MDRKRELIVDATRVAGCLLLTAFAVKGHWSAPGRPVIAVAGVLGSVAQLWRRRLSPLATVAGAAAYVLSGNPGPLALGLYSAGACGRRRLILILTVVGWTGFAGWSWIGEGRLDATDVATSALAAAAIATIGRYTATRHALQESMRERAELAEAGRAQRDEQARAGERARIAREMHDVLAHKVSLIAVHAGALELGASSDREREGAALIRVTAREALSELRAHAPGAPVTVTVERGDYAVTVTVHNAPAVGAVLDLPGAGAGLIGLTERLRLLGGSLRGGGVDDGWQLQAVIPR